MLCLFFLLALALESPAPLPHAAICAGQHHKQSLERYFCTELLNAVERGVSVRNFKVGQCV
jgi:hypothetical protein